MDQDETLDPEERKARAAQDPTESVPPGGRNANQ